MNKLSQLFELEYSKSNFSYRKDKFFSPIEEFEIF